MILLFKKLNLHNFGSYTDAEVNLTDRGFCLVSGKNLCKKDNATSNGSGKCFGKGTEILMFDGTVKPIEQIKAGDFIMGPDSTPRKVLEIHSGVDKLYRVSGTKTNNYSYICNGKHKLNLFQTCGGAFKNIPNEVQISVEDYLANNIPVEAKHAFKHCYNQMITTGVSFQNSSPLLLDPYIFGLWLGVGASDSAEICSADKEIISALYDFAANSKLDISVQSKYTAAGTPEKYKAYRFKESTYEPGAGHSSWFTAVLKQLKVLGYKHIPLSYLTASKFDRLALLAGIIDAEGALHERTGRNNSISYYFEIAQKSKELANEIVQLARLLGFRTTITEKICRPYLKDIPGRPDTYYRICINGDLWKIPTKVLRKQCSTFKLQHTHTLVPKITDAGMGTYYGFTCDGDHKFLLGDGTIVHNSTIWSAICYALTGETISGIKSNLKNINIDANECSVTLDFSVDGTDYTLTRIHKPKSDLKIIRNGEDISGKSIRESEKILAEYLPDLTKDLIASVIILGQGMPNKFSSFSPSGRKELLEKLTKSDFMIEDLKERLLNRQAFLQKNLQEYNSSILVNRTNLANIKANLAAIDAELNAPVADFEAEITAKNKIISELTAENTVKTAELSQLESQLESINTVLLEKTTKKAESINIENKAYADSTASLNMEQYKLTTDINSLNSEINRLKQIKDICPTCGQRLPNVIKPNTEEQEKQVIKLNESLAAIKTNLSFASEKHKAAMVKIESTFAEDTTKINADMANLKNNIAMLKSSINSLAIKINTENNSLAQLIFMKENYFKRREILLNQKADLQAKINLNDNAITIAMAAQLDTDAHLAVLKKMDTLVKRDFRGYLLLDIINYLDAKAKEYCEIVFGTDELSIQLSGNTLDITYCGKMFDSLSGGEKQRCDLILQFAIRDLLQTYLGYSANILVLDEIFDGLDKQATTKIIDLITTKLSDIESIFIISHHADELNIPVDSEISVIKNEDGISELASN